MYKPVTCSRFTDEEVGGEDTLSLSKSSSASLIEDRPLVSKSSPVSVKNTSHLHNFPVVRLCD